MKNKKCDGYIIISIKLGAQSILKITCPIYERYVAPSFVYISHYIFILYTYIYEQRRPEYMLTFLQALMSNDINLYSIHARLLGI